MSINIKISVIMPAFNAEQYIVESLESAINQSMNSSEYEIIVVNDGSTDGTQSILDDYSKTHENIIVMQKENGGPSSARNLALDLARGETIFFLDADDILEQSALEQLYDTMMEKQADLVIARYDIFDEHKKTEVHRIDELVQREKIDKFDPDIISTFVLWNKLFRKSIIRDHHIQFAPISYSEDGVFLYDYLYWCESITGLDRLIIHYRKYKEAEFGSITSGITESKITDYVTAHHLILESAKRSLMTRYDQYRSFEELIDDNMECQTYIHEIMKKELRILLKNFYPRFWKLKQHSIESIVAEIHKCVGMIDLSSLADLEQDFSLYSLGHLDTLKESVFQKAIFCALLYGDKESEEQFRNCLKSLMDQDCIFFKIYVPESMLSTIREHGMELENIVYIECRSLRDFYQKAVSLADTEYICICNPHFSYRYNTFSYMAKQLGNKYVDFIAMVVYHNQYEMIQPITYSKAVCESFAGGCYYSDVVSTDLIFGNKFFRTDFLKSEWPYFDTDIEAFIKRLYKRGSCRYLYGEKILYRGDEESYKDLIRNHWSEKYLDEYERGIKSLRDKRLLPDPGNLAAKMLPFKNDKALDLALKKCLEENKGKKIENRVLFVSIRSDDILTGNALSLYQQVKGCKKQYICRKLPHDIDTALEITELIMTSRIIVTDDYLKYVRYIPLRPQQRLIQIWHACGAFKQFGCRGTNLARKTDIATHAQYNLVCVSGQALRPIYADAFDVDVNKVYALGTPRTDVFYDESTKEHIREQIFRDHPDLSGKHVILYAPTFRDVGKDRTQFHPDLDFDFLSKSLQEDQVMVICPHPLMENSILDKSYDNIFVYRDHPTNNYMMVSDLLITDYSSVIFEYALLNKPIVFFCYDINIYNRGFYLRYPEDLPGPVITDQKELSEYLGSIKDYSVSDQFQNFLDKYMSSCDGHSAERIAALIMDYAKIPSFVFGERYSNIKQRLHKVPGIGSVVDMVLNRWEGLYGK